MAQIMKPEPSQIAWIILRAAKLLNVGVDKLALFLKGSRSKLINPMGDRQLFGALLWHDIPTIKGFIEQLVELRFLQRKIIELNGYRYPVLEVSESGEFVLERNIEVDLVAQKKEKPLVLSDSENVTFELFASGKNIDQIMVERELAKSTIYSHLEKLIKLRLIQSLAVVSDEKAKQILAVYKKDMRLRELKDLLSDSISFEEIRCAVAGMESEEIMKAKTIERTEDDSKTSYSPETTRKKTQNEISQKTPKDKSIKEESFWSKGSFAETLGSDDAKTKMRTFHMKHDEEMNYNCSECKTKISAHNKDWHNGMCDDCFFSEYFPEDAQIFESEPDRIRRHCNRGSIKKENLRFKEFLRATNEWQQDMQRIVAEIEGKIKCPHDGMCCKILKPLSKDNLDLFIQNAALCPIVFNVLENAKGEFIERQYEFENPDL